MKVLAVLHYQKYVVVDAPSELRYSTVELLDDKRAFSLHPDSRNKIIELADEAAKNSDLDWVYSEYYKEATQEEMESGYTNEQDGWTFSNNEWFDI